MYKMRLRMCMYLYKRLKIELELTVIFLYNSFITKHTYQTPYLALGSLRDQLLYPGGISAGHQNGDNDRYMEQALRRVSLGHVLNRDPRGLDAHARWSEELSVGEQQRLAFARLLVAKPRFVILDEVRVCLGMCILYEYVCAKDFCCG
jgi:ABC-type transport system involved in cytochrome bd biosynthesis fused ATPase/permease subunit